MFPLRADIHTRRFPAVSTTLIALGLAGLAAAVTGLIAHGYAWHLLAAILFLKVFGPGVEESMGRAGYLAFCLLGGGAAGAAVAIAEPGAGHVVLCAGGAVAAVLAAHLVLSPKARVVALTLAPAMFTVTTVPGLAVLMAWLPIQVALALTSAGGATGATVVLGQLGGIAVGLLTVRLFARERGGEARVARAAR